MRIRVKIFTLLTCCLVIFHITTVAYAHPGKIDANGGHRDSSTGEYHYHHGYGPHQHTDRNNDGILECPYDFQDQTGFNRGNTTDDSADSDYDSFGSKIHTSTPNEQKEESLPIGAVIYFAYAIVAGAVCIPIGATLDGATNKKSPSYKKTNRIFTLLLWTAFPISIPLLIIAGYLSELTSKRR